MAEKVSGADRSLGRDPFSDFHFVEHCAQGSPMKQFHGNVDYVVIGTDVVDTDDVGVRQLAGDSASLKKR